MWKHIEVALILILVVSLVPYVAGCSSGKSNSVMYDTPSSSGASSGTGSGTVNSTGSCTSTGTGTGSVTGGTGTGGTGSGSGTYVDCLTQDLPGWTGTVQRVSYNSYTKVSDILRPGKVSAGTEDRGWIRLDLSPVPPGATIISATLHVYHLDSYNEGTGIESVVQEVPVDSLIASAEDIFADSTHLLTGIWGSVGRNMWIEHELNVDGVAGIQNALSRSWYAVKIVVSG
ncbi:MAG: hypothetical protein ACYS8W_19205 [Planctomycetota bacterium]|jgi:hypothetical protein